jgi:hypothetical protein
VDKDIATPHDASLRVKWKGILTYSTLQHPSLVRKSAGRDILLDLP